jgi:hypothetical protein
MPSPISSSSFTVYARARGPQEEKPAPLTAAEAVRQAADEGLTLERSGNATGFRGVWPSGRRFVAQIGDGAKHGQTYLGTFDTAEEAALACARARTAAEVSREEDADDALDEEQECEADEREDGIEDEEQAAAPARELTSHGGTCVSSWERLDMRCAYSHERLTDPAKADATACCCLARCNYGQLSGYVRRAKKCPLCSRHTRDVERDDALRALLQAVPAHVDVVWVRDGELCVDDPAFVAQRSRDGKRTRGGADEMPRRASKRRQAVISL